MSNHAWTQENLAAYTMGGLSAQECADLETHLAGCAECSAILNETRDVEKIMDDLFSHVHPDAGLEERALQSLQGRKNKPVRRRANWLLFVGSAAAVLVLGLVGAIAQSLLEGGMLPGGPVAQNRAKKSFFGLFREEAITAEPSAGERKESFNVTDVDPSPNPSESDKKINYSVDRIADVSVPGMVPADQAIGIKDGDKTAPPVDLPAPGGFGSAGQGGAIQLGNVGGYGPKGKPLQGSFFGRSGVTNTRRPAVVTPVLDGITKTYEKAGKGEGLAEQFERGKRELGVFDDKRATEGESSLKKVEELKKALEFFDREEKGEKGKETKELSPPKSEIAGKDLAEYYKNHGYRVGGLPDGKPGDKSKVMPTFADPKVGWAIPPMQPVPTAPGMIAGGMGGMGGMMMGGMPGMMGGGMGGMGGGGGFNFAGSPGGGFAPPVPGPSPSLPVPTSPSVVATISPPTKSKGKKDYFVPEPSKSDNKGGKATAGEAGAGDKKPAEEQAQKQPPGKPPVDPVKSPETAKPTPKIGRMIIRTGEMEFETDTFDGALQVVSRLIADVKGAFIATVNSDKLPNGKARGSVVVRMPPEFLDKFIYDLRRDLVKTSDLKSQRLGSIDVTKLYYDIDSRLRAARTMEDRLLSIIKTGKGTVKELVEAERELGVWRTKIEEMEGELRYYSNQVSLATLTIILSERELQAPTALVLTSSVNVRLEVDDVSKAHQDALRAAEEVKGRITRSDVKTHTAGQIEAVLSIEVPPAKKNTFFLALSKLGIVSDHRENSSQRTEGGSGKPGELKPRQEDVRFEIQMMNNANLMPKQSVQLTVATTDVNGNYTKLQAEIAKLKGQTRDAQINEADKLNTFAIVDFNIPTSEKGAIDKLIESFGETLSRSKSQAPVGTLTSERKFGYSLNMIDYGSAKPRTVDDMHLATLDVPGKVKTIVEAVNAAKGNVRLAQINEKDKRNITAQLYFIVATEDKAKFDKLLGSLASVLSKSMTRTPASEIATEKKHGYSVQLQDFISVMPRTSDDLTVATQDVPAKVRTIVEAVRISKGYVLNSQLNEQDKLNITATLTFAVDVEEKATFEKLFETIGTVLSRATLQAPMNAVATEQKHGYSVQLRDIANVLPRQAANVTLAVTDVAAKYQELLDAVAKAKGQVSVSQLNEQDRNNINGTISFTIPSEQRESLDKLIDAMGMVVSRTKSQAPNQQLSTERKFGYSLALRDFITVQPKHSLSMTVAVQDVPAKYQQLVDAIAKAKGRVRASQLSEQDRNNVNAVVDFTIPTEEKAVFDKLFEEFGQTLSRNNVQAGVNDISTDKKFGYSLQIRDLVTVLPRRSVVLTMAANDVPAKYAAIQAAVAEGKGHVIVSHLNEKDKLNVTFQFDFSIPMEAKPAIDKAIADIGPVLSRDNLQAAPNQVATDRKFGFSIIARDFANIPPRETYFVRLAAQDVTNAFNELKEKAVNSKAVIAVARIDEENKSKISAVLDFDVVTADKQAIETLISKVGGTMSRKTSQAQANELATEVKVGYRLIIDNAANVPPRERFDIKVEVKNVDEIVDQLRSLALATKGGRVSDSKVEQEENGNAKAEIVIDVPLASQDTILNKVKAVGTLKSMTTHPRNLQVPDNEYAIARVSVHIRGGLPIVPSDESLWSPIRMGLYRAFAIFSYCIMVVIIGLAGVLPWVLLFYGSFRIVKWMMRANPTTPADINVTLVPEKAAAETKPEPAKTEDAK